MTPPTTAPPPADYDSLRNLVIARRDQLPRRLAQVAEYLLGQPDEIAFGTVATIAAPAGVKEEIRAAAEAAAAEAAEGEEGEGAPGEAEDGEKEEADDKE